MTALDERYGRTRSRRRRDLWIVAGVAVAFVVVFAAWVIWAGLDGTSSSIDTEDTKHEIIDAHSVSVTFEISMAPGMTASCAVQALDEDFSIVGWKVIDIPASSQYTRSFTEVLRTAGQSNTGLIKGCWPT
ncbi:DUF4307 domain-containing protein [Rathayibacter sp. YIM 133350]|uniref:DUF4307 domain-containing protein n=1 Tax=Rathayibacter sp. YIM 133350 TaxID=3131992 RepID=UPI00307D3E96